MENDIKTMSILMLIYGRELTLHQRADAKRELDDLIRENKKLKHYINSILNLGGELYQCENCGGISLDSELIGDDYESHKGFSEELFCPHCKTRID